MFKGISNKKELATTPLRQIALDLLEEGLKAIDTGTAIERNVFLENEVLKVSGKSYNLSNYENVYVIGFGKASCDAAEALEKVLGDRIAGGVVIDVRKGNFDRIESYKGSHPRPTDDNVRAAEKIVELAKDISEKDLVIVAVSGGGSALLCYPESECEQGAELYQDFLKAGGTISELNVVRKHLSELKGGGLVKLLYPATIIGLVFSDVPGGELSDVASGPTFFDPTTIEDAKKMLERYRLAGDFDFEETPKDKKYFDRTENFCLVSNRIALEAIADKAREAGFDAKIVSEKMYGFAAETLDELFTDKPKKVLVGGGEPRLVVEGHRGSGGRNLYLANDALQMIKDDGELFISLASDGIDNCDAAGGIADSTTLRHAKERNISVEEHLKTYDCETLFKETGDAIYTGQTGSNVSDLLLYIREK